MPEIKGTHSAQIEREQRGYRWEWPGVPPGNVAPPPQIKTWAITVQEQPFHPGPSVFRGVGIPNVGPPVTSYVVTRQETPDHLFARTGAGVQGPNVGTPVSRAVFTRQEAPGEYQAFVRSGIQGPNVAPPPQVKSWSITAQEAPDHPRPIILPGVPPVSTGPATATPQGYARTVQELPGHPLPAARAGVQGPNVASGIGSISVRQEQPDHPRSYLLGVVFPRNPILLGSSAITTQQQPESLAARTWPGTPPVALIVPPVVRRCFTVQEQPWHPLPTTGIGVQTPLPVVISFNLRVHGYSGILQMPILNPQQDSEDSLYMLYEPYEFGILAPSNQGIPVTVGPSGFPLYNDSSQILRIEVPDGQAIRYEVNPVGRSVAASVNSPLLTGVLYVEWGPGWSLSFIDASTAP